MDKPPMKFFPVELDDEQLSALREIVRAKLDDTIEVMRLVESLNVESQRKTDLQREISDLEDLLGALTPIPML